MGGEEGTEGASSSSNTKKVKDGLTVEEGVEETVWDWLLLRFMFHSNQVSHPSSTQPFSHSTTQSSTGPKTCRRLVLSSDDLRVLPRSLTIHLIHRYDHIQIISEAMV